MSELEIKELQELQSNINYFTNELEALESSRRYTHGINQEQNNKCTIDFPNGHVHVNRLPNLPQDIFDLINTRIRDYISTLEAQRNKLVICTKSSSYKPIDILDKE